MSVATPANILMEQLKAAKVNGFPFFAYMGIKQTTTTDDVVTMRMPKNPKNISYVSVMYSHGTDTYTVIFTCCGRYCKPARGVYVGELAETIARGTGVF